MKTIFLLLVALGAAFAQPTMVQTTLSANMDATQGEVYLASGSGVTAGMYGYVDRELFKVNSISGTTARVSRGVGGKLTGHTAGIAAYFGHGTYFTAQDPAGRCTTATTPAVPFINYATGAQWGCSSGTWTQTNGGGSGGTSLGSLTGVIKATGGTPDVVAGAADNFVKVDGSSGPALGSLSGVIKSASGVPAVVSGIASNCVFVDGTSGTCGSGTGATLVGTDNDIVTKNGANGATRGLHGFTNDGTKFIPNGTVLMELGGDNAPVGANNFSAATLTAPFRIGTTDPATCNDTVREWFYNTTSNAPKVCNAPNVWTALSSGSSTIAEEIYLPTAAVTNSATLTFNSGFAAPQAATAGAGLTGIGTAPWRYATASFPVDTANVIYLIGKYRLPSTWNGGAVNIDLKWLPGSGGASGNIVKWGIESACVADAEASYSSSGPTFNTVVLADGTIGASPDSKALTTTIAPSLTGCAAGETMFFRIRRNSTTGNGDTLAQAAHLLATVFKFTRTN